MIPIADTLVQVALSADSRIHQPAVAAFVREIIMRQDAEGYARNCEALAAANSTNLSKIKCSFDSSRGSGKTKGSEMEESC